MRRFFILSLLFLTASAYASHVPSDEKLVVHEWGTFTSLQDTDGRAIGYLNGSDEPLPQFVHRLSTGLLLHDDLFSKSIGPAHPEVTMRLETPVIYFHPADKNAMPFKVDVSATFRGGVLSEYYPNAKAEIDGAAPTLAALDHFKTNETAGSLTWRNVRVGGDVKLPQTQDHVWLAPRAVDSAPITLGDEGERYIFYRGVGNIESPLKITREGDKVIVHETPELQWKPVWLAEFRADGACAFRQLRDMRCGGQAQAMEYAGTFKSDDFSKDNAAELRKQMRVHLIGAGLFEDEADAMLNTWQRSYFTGVGQRAFFLVPRKWVDEKLPLTISVPNELTRVMIGRIELVTPKQKSALAQLPANTNAWSDLGRFGYALVLDSLKREPNEALKKWANQVDIRERTPTTKPSVTNASVSVAR